MRTISRVRCYRWNPLQKNTYYWLKCSQLLGVSYFYSLHHIISNKIINRRMSASVLSMDSPSFRPHVGGGVGGLGGTSPHHQRHRSRTSSPLSHGSNPSGGGGGEGHSNALKSYSFKTPTGYVFYGEYIWWPTYLSICPSYNFLINIISTWSFIASNLIDISNSYCHFTYIYADW